MPKPEVIDEELEEKLVTDYNFYASNCLKIQTMEGNLVDLELNEVQTLIQDIFEAIRKHGRLIRVVILKARREGVSTYIVGRDYWKTSTDSNRYAMIITHEAEATDFLFGMARRFHVHNPWKPKDRYNSKKILEFNTDDGKGLDSAIRVGTAGKEDFGSAQLIHYLLLSEVSKWPKHTQHSLLTSVLQCVPDELDTEVIFESTAKGIGGEFYDRYWACRFTYEFYLKDGKPAFKERINPDSDPNNNYTSIFIPWFVFEKYQMEPVEELFRTEEEEHLVKQHGLTDKHLQWRRWCIQNKCGGSIDVFKQEYPSTAREAFISSGFAVFDNMKVEALMNATPKPVARYEVQLGTGNCVFQKDGRLLVWKEPIKGRGYVIGADVAEGLEKGDFDSVDVIDQLTGEQVAHWHGKLAPDWFGILLAWIGKRYNTAWLAPERNNHGITTVTKLNDLRYPRLYVEKVIDPPHKPRLRYGWLTTKANKFPIIDNLKSEINEGTHMINCSDSFKEMLSFKQTPEGEMEAEEGMFDDRVMSLAIAKYVRTRLPMISRKPQHYDVELQRLDMTPNLAGWV